MRRWQFSLRTLFVITTLAALSFTIAVLLARPPWHNKASLRLHEWLYTATGWQLHSLEDYSGVARFWGSDGTLFEHRYVRGRRHGRWVVYDESGAVLSECEYRNGEPWDGVCKIIPMKAWEGEYKAGKPWNGCLPEFNAVTDAWDWTCYIDGEKVTEEEYR